jgi:hypothetical protein
LKLKTVCGERLYAVFHPVLRSFYQDKCNNRTAMKKWFFNIALFCFFRQKSIKNQKTGAGLVKTFHKSNLNMTEAS